VRRFSALSGASLLIVLALSCTREQQDKAQKRAKQAEEEARRAAHEVKKASQSLAQKARQESNKMRGELGDASNDPANTADRAGDKLDTALGKAREAGREAKAKIQPAALEARVKTTLASALGLGTLSNISVTANAGVVTLSGSVATEEEKDRAERAALSVSGVRTVTNKLEVK